MQGVYFIKNIKNNKIYIGSSKDINLRIDTHFKNLNRNLHKNKKLQYSYNKYKRNSFIYGVLEITKNITKHELIELEFKYIKEYCKDILYNLIYDNPNNISENWCKSNYLLDLNGNIIKEFTSLENVRKFINYSYQLSTNTVNCSKIFFNQYRIVTKDFYENNLNLILSWKNYKFKEDSYKQYYFYDDILNNWVVKYKNEIIGIFNIEEKAIKISKHLIELISKKQI